MTDELQQRTPGMSPLQMIAEWRKGCSVAGPAYDAMFKKPEGTSAPEACHDCTVGLINAMEKYLQLMEPQMRLLRLWHWREMKLNRQMATTEHIVQSGMSAHFDTVGNIHMRHVQCLNDFFPSGDTAEADDAKTGTLRL